MARSKRVGAPSQHPAPPEVTPAEKAPETRPWFRVSGWRLRNKIALALAFPVISAAWFATDKAVESFIVQESHQATAGQVRVLGPALDFLYAAEDSYVQTLQTPPGSSERRAAAERVQETAEALTEASNSDSLTANQRVQIKNIVAWSEDLTDTDVDRVTTATNSQVSQLNSAVSDYFQTIMYGQVVPEASLQQISHVMDGHIALTQQRIYTAYDGDTVKNQPDLFQYIGIERGAIESLADSRPAGDPDTTNLRSQNVQRQSVVVLGKGELRFEPALELYETINTTVLDETLAALDANADEARGKAFLNLNILVLAILATLLFAWLIARLILNPVRAVRDGALAVANEQLPRAVAQIRAGHEPEAISPINVHTHEEMGQLARAVDDLHRTAVTLASGEAKLRSQVGEMFVTLSRRNTSLINQQLGLIEELERDEQDPRRLENLFRLDHLAARMRRTAESLVILSDAPVRQRETAALAVTDALQAATAGVQEYQRVELRGSTSVQIEGSASNDLVHLLTELIDNALSFSPPTAPVQVSTGVDASGVRVEVSDGGLGMPADMLHQINTMLAAQVGITPDAARRMGLFVVSRLAHRHALAVRLVENNRGGVTAVVSIPTALVVGGSSSLPAPANPAPVASAQPAVAPASAPTGESLSVIAANGLAAVPSIAPAVAPAAPLSDPLSDPLPAAVHQSTVPASNTPATPVAGGDSLPQRRPGATVPTRIAAVSPTGASLFGGAEAPDGGLFDRPAAAADPVEEPAEAPVEPAIEPAIEPIIEPIIESAELLPTSEAVPGDDISAGPVPPFQSLPAIDADVPVTPATTDSSVSMFGTPGEDTRRAPKRTEADNATVAARMGMFNALARGARGGSTSAEATAPVAAAPTTAPIEVPVPVAAPLGLSALDGPSVLDRVDTTLPATEEPQLFANAVELSTDAPVDLPAAEEASAPTKAPVAPVPAAQTTPAPVTPTPVTESRATKSGEVDPSAWLSVTESAPFSSPTVDAGWAAAEKVAKHVETETTGAGLPQRRPGQRLVPGAAAPTKELQPRDPEAIRRRLASHAAGVSRGRSATVLPTSRAQEEGQA